MSTSMIIRHGLFTSKSLSRIQGLAPRSLQLIPAGAAMGRRRLKSDRPVRREDQSRAISPNRVLSNVRNEPASKQATICATARSPRAVGREHTNCNLRQRLPRPTPRTGFVGETQTALRSRSSRSRELSVKRRWGQTARGAKGSPSDTGARGPHQRQLQPAASAIPVIA